MNILVLNYEFPPVGGGGSSVSYDISKELASRGHNIHVVTMHFKGLPYEEVTDGIIIHRVRCIRKERFVCHPWEQMTYILSAIAYLEKLLRNNSFDVVHAHFIIPTGVIALYLKLRFGIDYILTAHGSDVQGYNNKRFVVLHKILLYPWRYIVKKSAYIITLSSFLKELIIKSYGQNIDENRISIIQNGIDTSQYYSGEKKKMITLIGRIQETKGMQDVLKALSPDILSDWTVNIIGDGPYKKKLERIAEENGIADKVIFRGWMEHNGKELLEILSQTAVFVSGSHFENSPVTLAEAYCSGCRVLVSDIPGHREMMGDKAKYFKPGDINEIRGLLNSEMNSFENKETNGPTESDINSFDWSKRVDKYEELLLGEQQGDM